MSELRIGETRPNSKVKTELTTQWGFPLVQVTDEVGSYTYYYPECNNLGNPRLIPGNPWILYDKDGDYRVTIFSPHDRTMQVKLLAVAECT